MFLLHYSLVRSYTFFKFGHNYHSLLAGLPGLLSCVIFLISFKTLLFIVFWIHLLLFAFPALSVVLFFLPFLFFLLCLIQELCCKYILYPLWPDLFHIIVLNNDLWNTMPHVWVDWIQYFLKTLNQMTENVSSINLQRYLALFKKIYIAWTFILLLLLHSVVKYFPIIF